jgi:hypothetical protein
MPFFRSGLGTNDLAGNARSLLNWTAAWLLALSAPVTVGMLSRRAGRRGSLISLGFSIAFAAVVWLVWGRIQWQDAARPLPVVMAILIGAWCVLLVRRRDDEQVRHRTILTISLLIFAALCLGKMALNVRLRHYGFVLALPATLMTCVALSEWLPRSVQRFHGDGRVVLGAVIALIAAVAILHVAASAQWLGRKIVSVGAGVDAFLADSRGAEVNQLLAYIDRHFPPDATLAVVPEGSMLNYLSRRANPTGILTIMPTEVAVFGEERILAAFIAAPPDYVIVLHRDTSEHGAQFFGRDYARALGAWIDAHYEDVHLFGDRPLVTPGRSGALVKKRRVE